MSKETRQIMKLLQDQLAAGDYTLYEATIRYIIKNSGNDQDAKNKPSK
jgi:hypothetical protein